jgi:hypothetical protein
MKNPESEQKNHCSQCLRNIKGVCTAFKEKQWPCWAYIDNMDEFIRREKERKEFLAKQGIA